MFALYLYKAVYFQVSGTPCKIKSCKKSKKITCPYCFDQFLDLTRHKCKRNIEKNCAKDTFIEPENIIIDNNAMNKEIIREDINIFNEAAQFTVL